MAGTDRRRARFSGGPAIILVEPQLGENIGTAARAMFNCGLTDLRLVKPRDGWPSVKAVAAASGADAVLDKAKLFNRIEDAHRHAAPGGRRDEAAAGGGRGGRYPVRARA